MTGPEQPSPPTQRLEPEEIDDYLARGWFRFGGTMRTARFSVWEERYLRTTLWIRTPLQSLKLSKSNRKQLARTKRNYRIVMQDPVLDEEHEALYAAYIEHVSGDRPKTLLDFLGGAESHQHYPTREFAIYDGERLAAFGWFDEGADTLMSLLGAFHPDYSAKSLGYSTLLLEIDYGMEQGHTYHYPGYVLPGEPRMDYKLRPGPAEWLDPYSDLWRPWSELDTTLLPDRRMRIELDSVAAALHKRGVASRWVLNPMFELAHRNMIAEQMADEPLVLLVNGKRPPYPIVIWRDQPGLYEVVLGTPAMLRYKTGPTGKERSVPTALISAEHEVYAKRAQAIEAAASLAKPTT